MNDDAYTVDPEELVIEESEPGQGQAGPGQAGRHRPSADMARAWLRRLLRHITGEALAWNEVCRDVEPEFRIPPPHKAIKCTTGIGKSELARQELIAGYAIEAKRRGLPHRVLIPLPTHRLAGEAQSKMPAGITVATWQGRDSAHLATSEPMCKNLEAVKTAQAIGQDIEETACRNGEARCPFYGACHYQAQKEPASKADVVLVAHELLFSLPRQISKRLGLVFVDESFWADGITGTDLAIDRLAHELKAFPVLRDGKKLDLETMRLRDLIERLQSALAVMPDGYVTRAPLLKAGLLPTTPAEDSSCTVARRWEWQRKVDAGLRPDASDEDRKAAVKQFGFMAQLPRRAAMWHALGALIDSSDEASGRLILDTQSTPSGTVRRLLVTGHKEIAKQLASLPLVYADATLPFELALHYLPNLQLACDIQVDAPHMRVAQVVGLPVGKASLQSLPAGKRRPGEEERVARKRKRLVDAVRHLTQGRRGLTITYKDVEADFAGIAGVEVAHFGAIEGIDHWKDVDVLIIIGRPLPGKRDITALAAAITGRPIVEEASIEQVRKIQLRDGGEHALMCRVYAAPEIEMIRRAVTEAALDQAIGRARGVNRTEANPVEVFLILHDTVVTDLDVDEVVTFPEIEPDAIDIMSDQGWEPQMPADAAKLCPDLFRNREAAKKAYQRDRLRTGSGPRGPRLGTWPYKNISIRRCPQPPWVALLFQPCGRGQLPRFCMANLAKIPDPRAALEAALGPLAKFEVVEDPYQGAAPVTGRAAE